jgi:hypothetical protein
MDGVGESACVRFFHHKQHAVFASHRPFISSKSDHKIR